MTAAADWLETQWMKWAFTDDTVIRPTAWYVALHTADPGETGDSNECSYTNYARVALTGVPKWSVSGGQAANTASVTFEANGGVDPVTITHMSVWNASIGGDCLYKGALDLGKTFSQNDVPNFGAGEIILRVD